MQTDYVEHFQSYYGPCILHISYTNHGLCISIMHDNISNTFACYCVISKVKKFTHALYSIVGASADLWSLGHKAMQVAHAINLE